MKCKTYLTFKVIEQKPKTVIISVNARSDGYRLGTIRWFPSWRQYVFIPAIGTVWSSGCIEEVKTKIDTLMQDRARLRKEEKLAKEMCSQEE